MGLQTARADVSFTRATSRVAQCLEGIIPADFTGTVQCDGYQAYPSFARRSEGRITLAACWAHARRKFHEAMESAPQHAGWLLLHIQHLYRIEQQLRETRAGPRQRQARRAAESRMIVERVHRALTRLKHSRRHLPKSAMGRAIDYVLTLWPMLCVYLEDGRIEINNNPVERAIRPSAIGKKNWLFIGEAEAGQRSAMLFTFIEACRSRGIDAQSYLRDVLTRLPTMTTRQVKDVVPTAWGKVHQRSVHLQAVSDPNPNTSSKQRRLAQPARAQNGAQAFSPTQKTLMDGRHLQQNRSPLRTSGLLYCIVRVKASRMWISAQ